MNHPSLIQWLTSMVDVESVSGNENALVDYVWNHIPSHLKSSAVRIENNIVISCIGDEKKPTIGLIGHLDTVSPFFPSRVDGENIHGRGTSDMKAGLAVMMELLHQLDHETIPYNVVYVFYENEEVEPEKNGIPKIIAKTDVLQKIDLAILLEPTGNQVELGCSGSMHIEVNIHGKAGHSARPWLSANAIYKSLDVIREIGNWPENVVTIHGLSYHEVVSVTQISTTNTRNTIPGNCRLNVNYRFSPLKTVDEATMEMKQRLDRIVNGVGVWHVTSVSASGRVERSPLMDHFVGSIGATVGPKQGTTDLYRLTEMGLPALHYGPGEVHLSHRDNESVPISNLVHSYASLHTFLTQSDAST